MLTLKECLSEDCLKQGLHLRFSYYQFPVYITSIPDEETGGTRQTGIFPEHILPFVFGSLNITYEYILSEVLPYENTKANGTWPGDLGLLQQGVADVCVGIHNVEYDKFNDFCPFEYYHRLSVVFLASVGKKEIFDFFIFLYEVEKLVWYLLCISAAFYVLLSSLCDSVTHGKLIFSKFWTNCNNYFWIYLASIFCEGSPRTMSSRRSQFLLFLWLFVVLVLVNTLYSQFKGILLIRYDDGYFRTFANLARKTDVLPLIIPNSIAELVLRSSSVDALRVVYARALQRPKESFIELSKFLDIDTYQMVKDGTHVLISAKFFTKYILKDICSLLTGNRKFYFIPEELTYTDCAFQINWDFPSFLKDKINERFIRIREGGFVSPWFSPYYRHFERCQESSSHEENLLLEFKHMENAFRFYLSLLCLSTVIFILEKVVHIALETNILKCRITIGKNVFV